MRWGLAFAASLAAGAAQAAAPTETIRWVAQDEPPHFSFVQGKPPRSIAELGHGEVDGFMRVLLARMPEYRHEFVEASTARYEAESRRGETLCSTMHVRTPERLQWAYFSHLYPPLISREIHVIVPRDAAVRKLAREPNRDAWVREWRGNRADAQDMKRLNAYMDERARGGPRIE